MIDTMIDMIDTLTPRTQNLEMKLKRLPERRDANYSGLQPLFKDMSVKVCGRRIFGHIIESKGIVHK